MPHPRETPNRIHCRHIGMDSAVSVHEITQAAYAGLRGVLLPPSGTTGETVSEVRESLRNGGALACIGNEPAGAARYYAIRSAVLHIYRVAVLPRCRRRGVASALMEFLEGHAAREGFDLTQVEVRLSLPANLRLYEARGYVEFSRHAYPCKNDEWVVMRKRLT